MARVKVRTKGLSVFLLVAIIVWIVFAYGHLSNYRYTWYYRYNTNETQLHSKMTENLRLAEAYWNQLLKLGNYSHNSTSDICTVLITAPRGSHPLLHYTLLSLVKAMTPVDKMISEILVYNTARPAYLHKYAQQLSEAHIPFLKVINASVSESELHLKRTQFQNPYHQWLWAGSVDYISALSLCQTANSSHILILEDDLIFAKDFYTKIRSALHNRHDCTWIRLYRSDFWDGWETKDTPCLLILSACISGLVIFTWFAVDNRKYYRRSRCCIIATYERLSNISLFSMLILLIFWLLWFGFILMILVSTNLQNFHFIIGRKTGIHPIESSVPGALALLYPQWVIPILTQFLHKRLQQCLLLNMPIPIDLLLIEFLQQQHTKYQQCHLVPDLVDHIGVYSSSINKNQGNFSAMKQSGSFRWDEAVTDFSLN